MEIRSDYIFNSFAVVPDNVVEKCKEWNMEPIEKIKELFNFLPDFKWYGYFNDAEHWFDSRTINYHNAKDKWNWMVLQAYYADYNDDDKIYCRVLDDYLKSIGCEKKIEWGTLGAIIENMSMWISDEGINPKSTFDEIEKIGIIEFLANEQCYICNGNTANKIPEERY